MGVGVGGRGRDKGGKGQGSHVWCGCRLAWAVSSKPEWTLLGPSSSLVTLHLWGHSLQYHQ